MDQEIAEIQAIADNPAAPTFENTLVAMEEDRASCAGRRMRLVAAVSEANTNPLLLKVRADEAPKLAAHHDAIYLDAKLFARVSAVYEQRDSLKLDLNAGGRSRSPMTSSFIPAPSFRMRTKSS